MCAWSCMYVLVSPLVPSGVTSHVRTFGEWMLVSGLVHFATLSATQLGSSGGNSMLLQGRVA